MIGSLGFTEIAFILVLALLIFGPKRLPEIGRMVGKGLGEFRRASNDLKRTFNAELSLPDDEDRPKLTRAPRSETQAAASESKPQEPSPSAEAVARGSSSEEPSGESPRAEAAHDEGEEEALDPPAKA